MIVRQGRVEKLHKAENVHRNRLRHSVPLVFWAGTASPTEEAFEELEAVKPDMPDPSAVRDMLPPQRSQYERDRLPRGER